MKTLIWLLAIALLISSCTTSNFLFSEINKTERLGIYLKNGGNIPQEDWEIFQQSTEEYIQINNKSSNDLKLYTSDVDSNSIVLDFTTHTYVNAQKRIARTIGSIIGLTLPYLLTTKQFDIYVGFIFWSRNATSMRCYLTKDLDEKQSIHTANIYSFHNFEKSSNQAAIHKIKYHEFLANLFSGIRFQKFDNTINYDEFSDKVYLKDGQFYKCKVIRKGKRITQIKYIANDKEMIKYVETDHIKKIVYSYNEQQIIVFSDLLIKKNGGTYFINVVSRDSLSTKIRVINEGFIQKTKINNDQIELLIEDYQDLESINKLNNPDVITLNEGRKFNCKITDSDENRIHYNLHFNDKIIEGYFDKNEIKDVKYSVG